jgi:hypothetical protein
VAPRRVAKIAVGSLLKSFKLRSTVEVEKCLTKLKVTNGDERNEESLTIPVNKSMTQM